MYILAYMYNENLKLHYSAIKLLDFSLKLSTIPLKLKYKIKDYINEHFDDMVFQNFEIAFEVPK